MVINGDVTVDAFNASDMGVALQNFWRSAENLEINTNGGSNRWAVAQAAPFRRIDVRGNLFLFPWLNDKGQAFGAAKDWQTVVPTSMTKFVAAAPIPNWRLPLYEYFCRLVLIAPWQSFIGFRVDAAFPGKNNPLRP